MLASYAWPWITWISNRLDIGLTIRYPIAACSALAAALVGTPTQLLVDNGLKRPQEHGEYEGSCDQAGVGSPSPPL